MPGGTKGTTEIEFAVADAAGTAATKKPATCSAATNTKRRRPNDQIRSLTRCGNDRMRQPAKTHLQTAHHVAAE